MKIPFLSFEETNRQIRSEILKSFETFFDDAWYILGERVKQFETEYASFNNTQHCIGVSNGLDALHLALKVLDIGPGDEVILPSNTFIATVLAVSYVGAHPVFAEPDKRSYNIKAENISSAITSKTKAIMPVHLYGQSCEMESIQRIATKHQIYIIEDNAQSQGAAFNDKLTGSWGDINGTSFYPGKNLGALGDAGALTTNSKELADKAFTYRNYGSQKKYHNDVQGFNMRLDECQAGFLSIKLKYLKKWSTERQAIAQWYNERLRGIGDIIVPEVATGATHVYHLYVIRTKYRDELSDFLKNKGIGTLIHYPVPPHLQKAYAHLNLKKGSFPVAEEIADTCLSLPIYPGLTSAMVDEVSESIADFFSK